MVQPDMLTVDDTRRAALAARHLSRSDGMSSPRDVEFGGVLRLIFGRAGSKRRCGCHRPSGVEAPARSLSNREEWATGTENRCYVNSKVA
jgi:hypothetical protein